MKRKLLLYLTLCFAFASCGKYDDSEIKKEIAELQERVARLETLCNQLNANTASLQTILNALQERDAVTSVTPVTEDGAVVGYTIGFEKSSAVTIRNGSDGHDGTDGAKGESGTAGHTPVIGVGLYEGVYYWTVDGEFLTDNAGNKIRAQALDGTTGADAVAPQFRITDSRWELSTDGGVTWTDYGTAVGAEGTHFFDSVDNSDADVLVLTLIDGTVITLPKYKPMSLTLTIEEAYGITAGGSVVVPYSITGGGDNPRLTIFTQNGWTATQSVATAATGTITITAPADMKPDKVVVIAENGAGMTVMKTITFALGTITLSDASIVTDATEHVFGCPLTTNTSYTVEIPAEAQSWLSIFVPAATKAMRNENISFKVKANGGLTRYTTVKLKDNGSLVQTLFVMQDGAGVAINCATAGSLSLLISSAVADEMTALKLSGTLNADDYTYLRSLISGKKLTEIDLSGVTDTEMPSAAFRDMTKLVKIIFPAGLTFFPEYVCHNCQNLVSINIPATVTEIRQYTFSSTNKLATTTGVNGEMAFPDNVEYIRNNAFSNNSIHYLITKLRFGNGLKEIGNGAFRSFDFVEEVTFNEGLLSIGEDAFRYLGYRNNDDAATSPRPAVVLPSSLRAIGANAFTYAKLSLLDFGTGVHTIGNSAFYGAKIAGDIVVPENVTTLGTHVFYILAQRTPATLTINADITVIPNELCAGAQFKQVVLKNEVTEIGSGAFRAMRYITTPLVLPTELVKIGDNAFRDGSTFSGTLSLPDKLETIGSGAFYSALFTGTLTIPASVKTIGNSCFQNCKGFTGNLVIPDGVTSLGSSAFYQCSGFNGTLTIGTGVPKLNGSTFRECTGLTGDIIIPDNIQQIWEYEFYGCTGFDGTLRLPVNAKFVTLYGWAFYNCNNLTGVVAFPANLTYIGGYSFQNCSKLSGDLNLENVTRIDTQAFRGCTGLNGNVLLGSNLQYLQGGVFYECSGITKFQCKRATPPSVATDTFYGITATTLEVPAGAAEAYEAAVTWKDFAITEVATF